MSLAPAVMTTASIVRPAVSVRAAAIWAGTGAGPASAPPEGPVTPAARPAPEQARSTSVTEVCGSASSSCRAASTGPARAERWQR